MANLPKTANRQDKLLLAKIRVFLEQAGYNELPHKSAIKFAWCKDSFLLEVIWVSKLKVFMAYFDKMGSEQGVKVIKSVQNIKDFEQFYFGISTID
jgi:hypothetical protein